MGRFQISIVFAQTDFNNLAQNGYSGGRLLRPDKAVFYIDSFNPSLSDGSMQEIETIINTDKAEYQLS